jgi:hypothetical protein
MKLRTDPGLADPDAIYTALVDLHRDLSEAESRLVNAKLVLLLANHIGDPEVLREAMAAARKPSTPSRAGGEGNWNKEQKRGN